MRETTSWFVYFSLCVCEKQQQQQNNAHKNDISLHLRSIKRVAFKYTEFSCRLIDLQVERRKVPLINNILLILIITLIIGIAHIFLYRSLFLSALEIQPNGIFIFYLKVARSSIGVHTLYCTIYA